MKISVIIPTYNESKGITNMLQQFQELRGTHFEVIVSDNGSTDDTKTIARSLCDKVVGLSTDARTTIGECRNRGARAATGDILWFLDADVRVPNINTVQTAIIEQFTHNAKLVALLLPLGIYPSEVTLSDKFWFGIVNVSVYIQNSILQIGAAPGDCQIMLRREFERVKGFKPELATAEDFELFHRLIKNGKVKTLWKYPVQMSARRIRRDGWGKVLYQWAKNWMNCFVLHRTNHDEWIARR